MAHLRTFRGLQALRIAAALLVLVTHAGFYASERLTPGFRYWERGAVGVELFFVLSGFVMVYSSHHLVSDSQGWRIFAERRIARIVPMYWLATTLKLATMLLTAGLVLHARLGWQTVLSSYFFVPAHNIDGEIKPLLAVGWTLNFEMFFYLLFALALLLRRNLYGVIGPILVALAVGSYFVHPGGPAAVFYVSRIGLDFLWGMLIARATLHRDGGQTATSPSIAVPVMLVGLLFLLVIPCTEWKFPVLGIAAALVVWATVALEPSLGRIPRWVLFLGDASYVLYLFHPMIAPLAPTLLLRLHARYALVSILLSIVLAVAVTAGLHQYIERPVTEFLRERLRVRGRRFVHSPDKATVVP